MSTIYLFAPFDAIPGEGGYPMRFGALQRSIRALGHRCIWWVSDWQHAGKLRREPTAPDADIRLLPAPEYQKNVSLARWRNHRALARAYVSEVTAAVESGEIPAPDVQLYALPPLESAEACRQIQQRFGGALILDVMDLWPETFYQTLALAPKGLRSGLGRLLFYPFFCQARNAVRIADGLTAQSKSFREWALRLGYRGEGSHVCYLGAEMAAEVNARQYRKGERLRLAYLGMMGMSYDLETLLRAVSVLVEEGHSIKLDLAGVGPKEPSLKALAKGLGLEPNIQFHGYLKEEALSRTLANAHLGIVPMFPDSGVAVPYKVCEYASSGLAIIHSLPGELDNLILSFGAGSFYEAGSLGSLTAAIYTYIQDPIKIEEHSKGAILLAREKFDRKQTFCSFAEYVVGFKST